MFKILVVEDDRERILLTKMALKVLKADPWRNTGKSVANKSIYYTLRNNALGHFCVQANFFDLFRGKGRWKRCDGHLMNSGFRRRNTKIYKILIHF